MSAGFQEIDAALANEDSQLDGIVTSLAGLDTTTTKLVEDIKALKAKVTPDLQPQLDKILANATKISNVSTSVSNAVGAVAQADVEATS